jgi:polar amino acid transport system substrate-binding protein
MKILSKVIVSVLMAYSVMSSTGLSYADNGPLILEDPWPPYTFGEDGQPDGGIAVEITKTIFRRIGLEPRLGLFPWKRVLKMAEMGRADGIMLLMKKKDREAYLVYTDKLFTNRDRVYGNNDTKNITLKSLSSLKDFRIGYVMGYSYGDTVDKLLSSSEQRKISGYTPENIIASVVNKRVDFIIEIKPVVDSILKNNVGWTGNIHEMNIELETYDYYMAISKKSKYVSYIPKMNKVINQMKQDGTMDRLVAGGKAE